MRLFVFLVFKNDDILEIFEMWCCFEGIVFSMILALKGLLPVTDTILQNCIMSGRLGKNEWDLDAIAYGSYFHNSSWYASEKVLVDNFKPSQSQNFVENGFNLEIRLKISIFSTFGWKKWYSDNLDLQTFR